MVQIFFYGGINEIGGNKILLKSSSGNSTLLDFGLSFSTIKQYYDIFTRPRTGCPLNDCIQLGLLPSPREAISRIYRDDLDPVLHVDPTANAEAICVKDVYLSHAHLDHVHDVKYLHKCIKIACSAITKIVLEQVQLNSRMGSQLITYTANRLVDGQLGSLVRRDWQPGDAGELFPLAGGDFKCSMHYVDHSIPGATGLLLEEETTDRRIAYTGDLRMHGRMSKESQDFIDFVADAHPDALIIEGTRLTPGSESELPTEQAVEDKISQILKANSSNLALFGCSGNDLARLTSFYNAANISHRALVVDYKIYELWKRLCTVHPYNINIIKLKVYLPRQREGDYSVDNYQGNKSLTKLVRDPGSSSIIVKAETIREHPENYLVYLPRWHINELLDLKPAPGFTYIWSMSDPFDLEGEIAEDKFNAWMDKFKGFIEKVHCSGHARPHDLATMVNKIRPKLLIPVHTAVPRAWESLGLDEGIKIEYPVLARGITI
nr:MBL fold metallo-hydrolase [Candidatus Sigynarchaeota archaeon]